MEESIMRKYKVIIWGLGNVGRAAVRMCMEKESLELVGVLDVDPKKIGRDAGEIFDFGKAGVLVSSDIDKVFSMDADVILNYTPLIRDEKGGFTPSAEGMVKALGYKKNVITTIPIYYSQATTPELFKMIDDAAKKNGVTYLPSGLLPGAYASYIPMVMSGIMGKVDKIVVESGEDDQHNFSGWVKVFGYGVDPKLFPNERLKAGIVSYYSSGVYEMGDVLGFKFTEFRASHEVFTAPVDLHPTFGEVKAGTICGHRFTMTGVVDGEEKVTLRYVHKICDDVVKVPVISDNIHIEGCPSTLDIEIKGMMPLDESYVTSAAPTVNIIPSVVNAEPGFKQAMELPVVKPII
jgi:2,4-diaminopentanoate dehydrogenase